MLEKSKRVCLYFQNPKMCIYEWGFLFYYTEKKADVPISSKPLKTSQSQFCVFFLDSHIFRFKKNKLIKVYLMIVSGRKILNQIPPRVLASYEG